MILDAQFMPTTNNLAKIKQSVKGDGPNETWNHEILEQCAQDILENIQAMGLRYSGHDLTGQEALGAIISMHTVEQEYVVTQIWQQILYKKNRTRRNGTRRTFVNLIG